MLCLQVVALICGVCSANLPYGRLNLFRRGLQTTVSGAKGVVDARDLIPTKESILSSYLISMSAN